MAESALHRQLIFDTVCWLLQYIFFYGFLTSRSIIYQKYMNTNSILYLPYFDPEICFSEIIFVGNKTDEFQTFSTKRSFFVFVSKMRLQSIFLLSRLSEINGQFPIGTTFEGRTILQYSKPGRYTIFIDELFCLLYIYYGTC